MTDSVSTEGLSLDSAAQQLAGLGLAEMVRTAPPEDHPTPAEPSPGDEPPAAPEPAPAGEPASDDEPQSAEPDPAAASAPEPTPKTVKVTVDGQELEVPLDEALKGYSRTQDYTRKTQALAAEKKQFETERSAVEQERKALADRLTELRKQAEALTPKEPDWNALRQQVDRGELASGDFARLWAEWDQTQRYLATVRDEEKSALAKVQEDEARHFQTRVQAEQQRLLELVPEWKDPAVRTKEMTAITQHAIADLGVTEAELGTVHDARLLQALRNSWRWTQAQKAAATRPPAKPPADKPASPAPVKPGAAPPAKVSGKEVEFRQLRDAAKKTGNVADAALALSRIVT